MKCAGKASIEEEEDNDELEEDEFSVDVHTLCHPGKIIFDWRILNSGFFADSDPDSAVS